MLNLNDLHLFVRVIEHGGFSAASRQLRIPKSTISKRVAALEADLGARLLHRTSRSLALTEAGRDFLDHARAALIEAESAEEVVRRRLAEPTGTVRLTASVPTAQTLLADLLPRLAAAYPKLVVQLHATDRFVDLVQEGFDIAIRSHFAPLPDSALLQRRIGSQSLILVAAPAYLGAHGQPDHPGQIPGHDGLMVGPAERWRLQGPRGEVAEVAPRPRMIADESTVLLKAAAAGFGLVCLPDEFCRPGLEAGSLMRVLPGWTAGEVVTTLLMPHRRGQLPAVRVVVDFLTSGAGSRTDHHPGR
ncbi:LysR family transcriptional regulator [Frigidibacter albus]|uniref:LysR family transcriptional regulator n=2 Tax=Frigidibacter albus TaxID=1465486 RepID=A0A6L8VHA3_9RHOB|nr:LysR substrate-binding domain-containing protein [Frigidibacter albus]MZQ89111.1 LysR family transcriptional regulator [Frigidibacter albus]NBE30832.1 LysR family transcriptional regulator [Frigidibacter albus]GGH51363.1 LysR family transcriptional regulator [Frigidibacter albus]